MKYAFKEKKIVFWEKFLPYLVCFSASLFFAYELIQFHMMNALSSDIIRDLNLRGGDFGKLCASYLLADVIFLLPAGILLDRFSTRKLIISAMTLCIGGTFGLALSHTFGTAAMFHFLSGIGNAFCFLSCMILATRWFSQEKRSFIISLIITIGLLGGVIGQEPFAHLSALFGWRKTLWIDGSIGLLILGVIYLFVHDGPQVEIVHEEKIPFWEGVKRSCFQWQNVACGLYTCFLNMPLMVLAAVWASLFLRQVHHIEAGQAAFIASMVSMGTIVGSPFYGYLSNRLGRKKACMRIGALLSLAMILMIMFLPSLPAPVLIALFFLLGFFSSAQVLGYALITENNPKELAGISMGIAAVIIMGLPMFLQPLTGFILDHGWDKRSMLEGIPLYTHQNFIAAFLIFPICFLIAYFLLPTIDVKSEEGRGRKDLLQRGDVLNGSI